MKELIKPSKFEHHYEGVEEFDECRCVGPMTCNKVCCGRDGDTPSRNSSSINSCDDEILF